MAAKNRNDSPDETGGIVIKKYANRRLYNTASSSYVTLDHLCQMVKDKVDFVVYDAKTGDDITRQVLTQIIVEEEAKGENLLPISFLRQLISFYGQGMQWMVPDYLEQSMESLAANQEQLTRTMREALDNSPFPGMDELGKQNIAMFEKAMQFFAPFAATNAPKKEAKPKPETPAEVTPEAPAENPSRNEAFDSLQEQVNKLQQQLEALSKK